MYLFCCKCMESADEFFSRFYEDGGRAFKPLCNKTKYVEIAQKEAA